MREHCTVAVNRQSSPGVEIRERFTVIQQLALDQIRELSDSELCSLYGEARAIAEVKIRQSSARDFDTAVQLLPQLGEEMDRRGLSRT